jgi:formylglycine-generating enzyme required for sulfatase activity
MSIASSTVVSAGGLAPPAERFIDWHPIGSGGVADVYKVLDRDLGVELAIKILKQIHRDDRRYVESLRREVLISRKLRHPNICPIHDLYEGPQGVGIVMDLIEGQDLKAWLIENRGRLLETIADRLLLLRKLTDALVLAHSQIVHRDLKPANIFLKRNDIGTPIIMDFGLSVSNEQGQAGAINGGTPKYMAPEQLVAPQSVDRRADIFALGIMAYEILTDGEIPACSLRDSALVGMLPAFRPEDILPPSTFCAAIPADLDRLLLQMLEHDPGKRPQSADEVKDILDRVRLLNPLELPSRKTGRTPAFAVPAGTYFVGERNSARACEQPQRKIRLSAFRIGFAPVTNGEYREFVRTTGYRAPPLLDHPRFGHDSLPVVMVTWEDASTYARWAGGRLPTELEWEVAARAGNPKNQYPWGETPPLNTQANIDSVCGAPTAVRSYPTGANEWGLVDLCGNVWEWCADPWDENLLKNVVSDAVDPVAKTPTDQRAIRGGSFDSLANTGRCGFRHRAPRAEARCDLGFRIAYDG